MIRWVVASAWMTLALVDKFNGFFHEEYSRNNWEEVLFEHSKKVGYRPFSGWMMPRELFYTFGRLVHHPTTQFEEEFEHMLHWLVCFKTVVFSA